VPEVLREKSSLSLEDVSQRLQLVEDVHRISSLQRKNPGRTGRGAAIVRRQAENIGRVAKGSRE
jgi:hypothetical protein